MAAKPQEHDDQLPEEDLTLIDLDCSLSTPASVRPVSPTHANLDWTHQEEEDSTPFGEVKKPDEASSTFSEIHTRMNANIDRLYFSTLATPPNQSEGSASTFLDRLDKFGEDIVDKLEKMPEQIQKLGRMDKVKKVLQLDSANSSNDAEEVKLDSADSTVTPLLTWRPALDGTFTVKNPKEDSDDPEWDNFSENIKVMLRKSRKESYLKGRKDGSRFGSVAGSQRTMSYHGKVREFLQTSGDNLAGNLPEDQLPGANATEVLVQPRPYGPLASEPGAKASSVDKIRNYQFSDSGRISLISEGHIRREEKKKMEAKKLKAKAVYDHQKSWVTRHINTFNKNVNTEGWQIGALHLQLGTTIRSMQENFALYVSLIGDPKEEVAARAKWLPRLKASLDTLAAAEALAVCQEVDRMKLNIESKKNVEASPPTVDPFVANLKKKVAATLETLPATSAPTTAPDFVFGNFGWDQETMVTPEALRLAPIPPPATTSGFTTVDNDWFRQELGMTGPKAPTLAATTTVTSSAPTLIMTTAPTVPMEETLGATNQGRTEDIGLATTEAGPINMGVDPSVRPKTSEYHRTTARPSVDDLGSDRSADSTHARRAPGFHSDNPFLSIPQGRGSRRTAGFRGEKQLASKMSATPIQMTTAEKAKTEKILAQHRQEVESLRQERDQTLHRLREEREDAERTKRVTFADSEKLRSENASLRRDCDLLQRRRVPSPSQDTRDTSVPRPDFTRPPPTPYYSRPFTTNDTRPSRGTLFEGVYSGARPNVPANVNNSPRYLPPGYEEPRDRRAFQTEKPLYKPKPHFFDGTSKTDEWTKFRASFDAAVGSINMPDKQKLLMLLDQLQGEPAKIARRISGDEYSTETYLLVWHTLEEHYGGLNKAKKDVLHRLETFPKILRLNKENALEFASLLLNILNKYAGQGPGLIDAGGVLSSLAKKILPEYEVVNYFQKLSDMGDREDTLIEFYQSVERRRIALTLASAHFTGAPKSKGPDPIFVQQSDPVEEDPLEDPPSLGLVGQVRYDKKKEFKKVDPNICPICKTDHRLFRCEKFKELPTYKKYIIVKDNGGCYHCLNFGHNAKDCTWNRDVKCGIEDCQRYHHNLLHNYKDSALMSIEQVLLGDASFVENQILHVTDKFLKDNEYVSIRTATVLLTGPNGKSHRCLAALDTCSNSTNVDADLAEQLGFRVNARNIQRNINFMERLVSVTSDHVSFTISPITGGQSYAVHGYTVKDLISGTPVINWEKASETFHHLKQAAIPKTRPTDKVQILLGADFMHLMAATRSLIGKDFEPTAELCRLGWAFAGRVKKDELTGDFTGFVGFHYSLPAFTNSCNTPSSSN